MTTMDRWRGVLCGAVALIALGGCQDIVRTQASAPQAAVRTQAATALVPADFVLTVKVTRKSCFEDAGCNVSYHIEVATWKKLTTQRCLVVYMVSGMRRGPQVDSFTIENNTFSGDGNEDVETASAGTKLTAKVIAVEKG